MNIDDFNWLVSDQYFEAPLDFRLIESHIRAAHPEKYSPLDVEDDRFSKEFSWMRIHAWASSYLYFWCIQPAPNGKSPSPVQRYVAVFVKPQGALLDASVDTLLLLIKLALLAERVVTCTAVFFLKSLITVESTQNTSTVRYVFAHTCIQFLFFLQSCVRLCIQPYNILVNLFSPQIDLPAILVSLSLSYAIKNPYKKREIILDQGRVKYLREHCGWEYVTDTTLKSLECFNPYHVRYFEKEGKLCLEHGL